MLPSQHSVECNYTMQVLPAKNFTVLD